MRPPSSFPRTPFACPKSSITSRRPTDAAMVAASAIAVPAAPCMLIGPALGAGTGGAALTGMSLAPAAAFAHVHARPDDL